jgi:hypothetical protein
MIAVPAYIEPLLMLPINYCEWGPCLSDSSICGCFEGVDASGACALCSLYSTEAI